MDPYIGRMLDERYEILMCWAPAEWLWYTAHTIID